MAGILFWVAVFAVSLLVLVKSSDMFTDAAEKIGLSLGLPSFIVGVTIVALGTSLPELVSSIVAVTTGASEIVVGNVVGSNIANILFVLGITALVGKKITASREMVKVDLPILIASAFLLVVALWDGVFQLFEAILFLAALGAYLHFTIAEKEEKKELVQDIRKEVKVNPVSWKDYAMLTVTAVFIYLGANYTVTSILELAEILQIGVETIAVSAVAFGTSLPELAVSISAARKSKADIAVGNILGSSIFNTYAVMGIPALIGSLTIPSSILQYALPVMVLSTLLYFFVTQDNEITRWEGGTLLLFYLLFIGNLVIGAV